jgi:hypothetical protein
MYVRGGDASERDYLSESRRLVSTHCRAQIKRWYLNLFVQKGWYRINWNTPPGGINRGMPFPYLGPGGVLGGGGQSSRLCCLKLCPEAWEGACKRCLRI